MTEWERVSAAFEKLADAFGETVSALIDWVGAAVKALCEALPYENIITAAAYAAAKREKPEWVHKANYCKKKRIRKKYHDKIMRTYGRG